MSNDDEIFIMDILSDYFAIVEALGLILMTSYLVYKDQLKIKQIFSMSDNYRRTIFLYHLDLWLRIIQEMFTIIQFYDKSEFKKQTILITAQLESASRYALYLFFYLSVAKKVKKKYKVSGNTEIAKIVKDQSLYLQYFNIINIGFYYSILSLGFKSYLDDQTPGGTQRSLLGLIKLILGITWSLINLIYFQFDDIEKQLQNKKAMRISFQIFCAFILQILLTVRNYYFKDKLKQIDCKSQELICGQQNISYAILFLFYYQLALFIPITTIFFYMRQYNQKKQKQVI